MYSTPRALLLLLAVIALARAADPYGIATRPAPAPYLGMPVAPPVQAGGYTAQVAFPLVGFQGPVAVRAVPGTTRLWVLEREGRIWAIENDPTSSTKILVLDLNDDDLDTADANPGDGHLAGGVRWWCQGWDDSGLMGLAFHPGFGQAGSPNRGHFYLCYQARDQLPAVGTSGEGYRPGAVSWGNEITGASNRLARFTVPDGSQVADPASELILIDQPDRHLWHNGGDVFFANDGFLYFANGDEGKYDDTYQNSQRIGQRLFGGVLRIDVDGPRPGISHAIVTKPLDLTGRPSFTGNYGIPDGNPFVGLSGALEEFYAIGLRSPHRMTYDPPSGQIFVGDIGQGTREEISLIEAGGNYQWGWMEGNRRGNASTRRPPPYRLTAAASAGATVLATGFTAPGGEPNLSAGQIAVGERVRIAGWAGFHTVVAASGYPLSSLTISPGLVGGVAADTAVITTTGTLFGTAVATAAGTTAPNDVGSSTFTVTGGDAAVLRTGVCICFDDMPGTYAIIASSGTPPTQLTVRPALWSTPAANTPIDRATVLGRERPPLVDFARSGGVALNAIIGGYVYRGSALPGLVGRYIFGDNGQGDLFALDLASGAPVVTKLMDIPGYSVGPSGYSGLSGFGIDQQGELLFCLMQTSGATNTSTGRIFRLAPTGAVADPPIPGTLAQTGAFVTDPDGTLASLTPVAGLMPYTVNAPLWSDGADKRRWLAVPQPGGGSDPLTDLIAYAPSGAWSFPAGTVFVKHFELTVDERASPPVKRRLETRLLVRLPAPATGVYGVTYKWRPDGSNADVLTNDVSETYDVIQADGAVRKQTWYYPSRADCLTCHNANAGHVLGVNTRQLNGACNYPSGVSDNQLRTWNHLGLFDPALAEATIATLPRMAALDDAGATLEKRCRSWLDVNCSHCHRPGGVQTLFDARFDTPLRLQGLVDAPTQLSYPGIINPRVIAHGDLARSLLFQRDNSLQAGFMMPPLARSRVDDQAMGRMQAWIASLPYDAGLTLSGLARVYDGTPKPVTVVATTDGVPAIDVTYDGGTDPPSQVGSYAVVAAVAPDQLYSGSASGMLVIAKATAAITLHDLATTYDGASHAASATTAPSGLTVTVTYDGLAAPPSAVGSYAVQATIVDANQAGSASGTLTIAPVAVTVMLSDLTQIADGTPCVVTASTTPVGVTVAITYDGGASAPTAVGSYAVVATVTEPNHMGSANGTLVVQAPAGGGSAGSSSGNGGDGGGCGLGSGIAALAALAAFAALFLARLRPRG